MRMAAHAHQFFDNESVSPVLFFVKTSCWVCSQPVSLERLHVHMITACWFVDVISITPVASDGFFSVWHGKLRAPSVVPYCYVLSLSFTEAVFYHFSIFFTIFSIGSFANSSVFKLAGLNLDLGLSPFFVAFLSNFFIFLIWIVHLGLI